MNVTKLFLTECYMCEKSNLELNIRVCDEVFENDLFTITKKLGNIVTN